MWNFKFWRSTPSRKSFDLDIFAAKTLLAQAILREHFDYLEDDLVHVNVLPLTLYNKLKLKDDDDVDVASPVSWNQKRDFIVVFDEWIDKCSPNELAYSLGFAYWARHFNIKQTKTRDQVVNQIAANIRYEIDYNGHNAFSKNNHSGVLAQHREYMNQYRNLIKFEDVAKMSFNALYKKLIEKKDELYKIKYPEISE